MFEGMDDSVVLRRLRETGEEGLTKLFEQNRESLRQMVSRRIQGRLAARFDASDVIQESFMRAKQHLAKYLESPTIHPNVWLRITCRQLLAEYARKQLRGRRSPVVEVHAIGDQCVVDMLSDSVDSVGTQLAREELYSKVSEVITELSQVDREIIEMRHREDMTFEQIGSMLEVKMETAKKRYYRALEKVKKGCEAIKVASFP